MLSEASLIYLYSRCAVAIPHRVVSLLSELATVWRSSSGLTWRGLTWRGLTW